MANLKGSKTERNLLAAFAGESQARNRYAYFASAARKAGYEGIGAIFSETAENEKEHAKVFFEHLQGGAVEITATYPAGVIGDTLANLRAAAAGEHEEWGKLYPEAATTARQEGFPEVAESFEQIAKVESWHERRYNRLIERLAGDQVFKRPANIRWKCRNCGYVAESSEAPAVCPACKHPRAYYEPWTDQTY